jgi:hypothetical protein
MALSSSLSKSLSSFSSSSHFQLMIPIHQVHENIPQIDQSSQVSWSLTIDHFTQKGPYGYLERFCRRNST